MVYKKGDNVVVSKYLGKGVFEFYSTRIVSCSGEINYICEGNTGTVINIEGPKKIRVSTFEGREMSVSTNSVLSPFELLKIKRKNIPIKELSDKVCL